MKNIKKVLPLSVIMIVLFVMVGGLAMMVPFLMTMTQGMTINSISPTAIFSNEEDLEGEWFLVSSTLHGGQYMVGEISPHTFKDLTGYETKQTLKIEAGTKDEWATYNVINDEKPVYKYVVTKMDECTNDAVFSIYVIDLPWPYHVCVNKVQYGTKGSFSNPSVGFSSDLSVTVGSEKITEEVSHTAPNVDFTDSFGNIMAQASWQGSLMTGDPVPDQARYVAYYRMKGDGSTDRWYIATEDDYREYSEATAALDLDLLDPIELIEQESVFNKLSTMVQLTNNQVDILLNSDYKLSDAQNSYNTNELEGAEFRVHLDREILVPVVTWRIKADWLGVVIPVSQPLITNVNSEQFGSGEEGKITVTVKNDGDVGAEFTSSFYGCEPFAMKYSAPRNYLDKGQTKDIPLYISTGAVNYDVDRTCTVKVMDSNMASNYDEMEVFVSMTSAKVCTLNKISIEGKCIYKCIDETKPVVRQVCCEYGVKFEKDRPDSYDGWYCMAAPDEDCVTNADCDDDNDATIDVCETNIFGKKVCNHYEQGTCWIDSDCDDSNWLTVDSCKKGLLQDKGKCDYFDITPILAVLGLILGIVGLIVLGLIGFGIVSLIKKK